VTPRRAAALCVLLALAGSTPHARAASATECTANQICYCINQDVKAEIVARVAEIRQRIAAQRAQGKAIGYLSTPISNFGGGYEGVNGKVAENAKAEVERPQGQGDMEKLEAYYDENAKTDPELAKLNRRDFCDYYGLRASAAASRGSHDEWNIVRVINERRRHDHYRTEFGIGRQIAILFDGRALPPRPAETATAPGYVFGCP
jgi:hypothetical protein